MPLVKNDAIVEDRWTRLDDAAPLVDGPVVISLERWLEGREDLARRNGPLGIVLTGAETPEQIVDDLDRFALVCLDFPKFTDGRAYSAARLLRERYGFKGEIRATGNVLRDQYPLMRRCGFDAFEVVDGIDVAAWISSDRAVTAPYQPAADGVQAIWAKRQLLAKSA